MNFWKSSFIKLKQKLLKYFYIHQKREFRKTVPLYFWSDFVVPYLIIFFLYLINLSLYCSRPYSSFFIFLEKDLDTSHKLFFETFLCCFFIIISSWQIFRHFYAWEKILYKKLMLKKIDLCLIYFYFQNYHFFGF